MGPLLLLLQIYVSNKEPNGDFVFPGREVGTILSPWVGWCGLSWLININFL